MSNNAVATLRYVTLRYVTLRYVTYHLNFSRFSIAKIFSLNQFIFCPCFADISILVACRKKLKTFDLL